MEDVEKIYMKYANLVKNYIFCITKDIELSEEIMQETFVVAIDQINKFRGECDVSVWLCSIAKNMLYRLNKKDKKKILIPIDEVEIANDKLIEDEYISNDGKINLYKALQNVDIKTREVIYLRLTGELTFKEIGMILNKSENWARVTFYRGKEKIKEERLK